MQSPNGSANLTSLLTFPPPDGGQQQFVLRRPPFGVVAPGAHDMAREFRVLSRLWRADDRAPPAPPFFADPHAGGARLLGSAYPRGGGGGGAPPPSTGKPPPPRPRL